MRSDSKHWNIPTPDSSALEDQRASPPVVRNPTWIRAEAASIMRTLEESLTSRKLGIGLPANGAGSPLASVQNPSLTGTPRSVA